MTATPPNHAPVSNLLSTHRALLEMLACFLTVSTHHILYLRGIYPAISFLSTRAYNYPVRQNRHPAVCTWINDAIAAVHNQLEKSTVEQVSLYIYECKANRVLERWTFDLRSFPSVPLYDLDVPFPSSTPEDETALPYTLNRADLEANFRAMLSRISSSAGKLKPLPEGPEAPECSFTLAIEVKDTADRPVGRLEKEERRWIASEPGSFTNVSIKQPASSPEATPKDKGRGKTHPVRRLEVGALQMEVWVEESAAKFEYVTSSELTATDRREGMPYSGGTEKFDPVHGYDDVKPTDVNRKPQEGWSSGYH